MELACVLLIVGALVIAGVVQACATGRIGPNAIAGIRMPSVLVNEKTWRVGHQAALLATWSTSALAALFGGFALFSGSSQANMGLYVLIGAGILLAGTIWGSVVAHMAAVKVPLAKAPMKKPGTKNQRSR